MSDNKHRLGIILIVSGPSGAGKTTICKKIREEYKNLYFSVSCTTRSPRGNEVDGKDYYFVTKEEFKDKVKKNEFIEHAEVYGNSYGTLRNELIDKIKEGKDVLLDIDVQGAMQIKKNSASDSLLSSCIEMVFVAPPSMAVLENRLRSRKTDEEKEIKKRLKTASMELSFWREYDYLILNEDLNRAFGMMRQIVDVIGSKTKHLQHFEFK